MTKSWAVIQAQGQVPGPRWGHTAVVFQGGMYVFGGYSDAFHNELFKYEFGMSRRCSQSSHRFETDLLS